MATTVDAAREARGGSPSRCASSADSEYSAGPVPDSVELAECRALCGSAFSRADTCPEKAKMKLWT